MSNHTLLEFNHDYCPKETDILTWAKLLVAYLRTGDKDLLPSGVTFKNMRHHSEPEPKMVKG